MEVKRFALNVDRWSSRLARIRLLLSCKLINKFSNFIIFFNDSVICT